MNKETRKRIEKAIRAAEKLIEIYEKRIKEAEKEEESKRKIKKVFKAL